MKCVPGGSLQPSQQKPGIKIELSQEDLWRGLLSAGVDSHNVMTHKVIEIFMSAETLPTRISSPRVK